jgi:hypothetical protein
MRTGGFALVGDRSPYRQFLRVALLDSSAHTWGIRPFASVCLLWTIHYLLRVADRAASTAISAGN